MLKRENELRLGQEVQKRFEEAERSGSNTDWIEVATQVQLEVLREFNVAESSLQAYSEQHFEEHGNDDIIK